MLQVIGNRYIRRSVLQQNHDRPQQTVRFIVRRLFFVAIHRQQENERAALSFDAFALDPNFSAVQFHQLPRQRQPETGALLLTRIR